MEPTEQSSSQLTPAGPGQPHASAPTHRAIIPTSFPKFSLLPAELRDQIWDSSLRERRVLHVYVKVLEWRDDAASNTRNVTGVAGPWPAQILRYRLFVHEDLEDAIPALLFVSREARAAAQRFFRGSLPCCFIPPQNPGESIFPDRLFNQLSETPDLRLVPRNPEYDSLHVHCDWMKIPTERLWPLLQLVKTIEKEYVRDDGPLTTVVRRS